MLYRSSDKTGCINYAMGITQHTVGSQNVKSFAIVQLLLGNVGRAGGGINALRGENNVQGQLIWPCCSTFYLDTLILLLQAVPTKI